MTAEDQAMTQEGLGLNVGICLRISYSYDRMIGAQDSEWLQNTLIILINFFQRYRLVANVKKSQTMMCQHKALRSGISEEAVGQRCTGGWGVIP